MTTNDLAQNTAASAPLTIAGKIRRIGATFKASHTARAPVEPVEVSDAEPEEVSDAEPERVEMSPETKEAIAERDRLFELHPDRTPIVVLSEGKYYLRRTDALDYAYKLPSERSLAVELRTQFPKQSYLYVERDGRMVMRSIPDILILINAKNAHTVRSDFSATARTFNRYTATLTHGYGMCDIKPERNTLVEDWLQELSGRNLEGLNEWIASTHQKWIRNAAVACVIVGDPSVGKTLFARCLARTWRDVTAPVSLNNAVERFNGKLRDCPVWHADERLPKDLHPDAFRDLVQRLEHEIEPKGEEKQTLAGAARIICTLNQIDDFDLGLVSGPAALKAVEARLAIYTASPNTLRMLNSICKGGRADVDQIVGHLRWVQENYTPKAQRFLGYGFGRGASHMLAGAATRHAPEVFDALRQYGQAPLDWEISYVSNAPSNTFQRGLCFPIITRKKRLLVNCAELAARINRPAREVRNSLAQFFLSAGGDETVRVCDVKGGTRHKGAYRALDRDLLERAMGVDLEPVLAGDTGTRTAERFAAAVLAAQDRHCVDGPAPTDPEEYNHEANLATSVGVDTDRIDSGAENML